MNTKAFIPTGGDSKAPVQNDPSPVSIGQLADLAFFEGLSETHLAQIVPHTKISYFEPGQAILAQGELANRFYVLVSGRALIECRIDGTTVPVQEIGPGEAVGFSWFFTPENLHFTARAVEPVKAVFFYGTLLREDCDLDPTLGYDLMLRTGKVLMQRLEAIVRLLAKKRPAK